MIIFTKDAQKMEQKLVRYNTKLQKLASVDALTGLWNRRSMWEYIRAVEYDYEIGNAALYRSPLQILISLKGSMIPMGMMQVMKC